MDDYRLYYRRLMGIQRKVLKLNLTWGERWALAVWLQDSFAWLRDEHGLPMPKRYRDFDPNRSVDPPF